MKCKTKSDLHREYARVLDMCEGTGVQPEDCVRYVGTKPLGINWEFSDEPHLYSFATALLEGRPAFIDDRVYYHDGLSFSVTWADSLAGCSWNPPKKTFTLNGEELPLPDDGDGFHLYLSCSGWRWRDSNDRDKVNDAITKLLSGSKT